MSGLPFNYYDKKHKKHKYVEKIDNDIFLTSTKISKLKHAKKALSKGGYRFVL